VIYLACPYSHPDASIRQQRFEAACAATAALMRAGYRVFAPVVHGHPLTQHGLPGDWSFWEGHARWHLERCSEVVVLMLDGWDASEGVQAEIEIATELGKVAWYRYPVRQTTPTLAHEAKEAARWWVWTPTTKHPDVANVGVKRPAKPEK